MGAVESNAGDDFHICWAASRVLALIQPGTESRLVTVERLSRIDGSDEEYVLTATEDDELPAGLRR